MRETFDISYGSSCKCKNWIPSSITMKELADKIRIPLRTRESVEEYESMPDDLRHAVKDVGGFLGGCCSGQKTLNNIKGRSILTLDMDKLKRQYRRLLERLNVCYIFYTTHSHTPGKPRGRLIIFLSRNVTNEEYEAIATLLAGEMGIEMFDPVSFVPNQMMHWPSVPKDGVYDYVEKIDGPLFDPDEFLAKYPDWRDRSTWPVSPYQKKRTNHSGVKPADPLTKEGVIGAFCRAYSVTEAIEKFLPDVYESCDIENRYAYIPSGSVPGLIIYDDDRFAYSHHATDPAYGMNLNAFDLVRVHKFGDSFKKMCKFAMEDEKVKEQMKEDKTMEAGSEFTPVEDEKSKWDDPLPIERFEPARFPIDVFADDIAGFVKNVAEMTQTPVDMAACAAIAVMSLAMQKKYVVKLKEGWVEPLNTYTLIIALPSERKSPVLRQMLDPVKMYEKRYNKEHSAEFEFSKSQKRILEARKKSIEDAVIKGKETSDKLQEIIDETLNFVEKNPIEMFLDDVTPEMLITYLAKNGGHGAIVSSEAGILITLNGRYTSEGNIDGVLKSHSGDDIKVNRVSRKGDKVENPALTILLMAQPKIATDIFNNDDFMGRGLNSRFLYCMPESMVGNRSTNSPGIDLIAKKAYSDRVNNFLEESYPEEPRVITLSKKAEDLFDSFREEIEPMLKKELKDMSDWAGKLSGEVARLAGVLYRSSVTVDSGFLAGETDAPVIDENIMAKAISLGRYFLSHAKTVYNVIPENSLYRDCVMILDTIRKKGYKEFSRRTIMRSCGKFKKTADIQPVLDYLEDYGYIAKKSIQDMKIGRPSNFSYLVNPAVFDMNCNQAPDAENT